MPNSGRLQVTFLSALLRGSLTKQDVAEVMGVDRSLVSRWASAERALSLDDALCLVERYGGAPLLAAGRIIGLEIAVSGAPDDAGAAAADLDEDPLVRLRLGLVEALRVLVAGDAGSPARRAHLLHQLSILEGLLKAVQHRLSAG